MGGVGESGVGPGAGGNPLSGVAAASDSRESILAKASAIAESSGVLSLVSLAGVEITTDVGDARLELVAGSTVSKTSALPTLSVFVEGI